MATARLLLLLLPPPLLLLLLLSSRASATAANSVEEFPRDGRVIELDEGNFEAALAAIDYLFVDFYAPWCGHCKRLAPELDEAAPVLAGLSEPIIVAKVNADKYRKLGSKYGVESAANANRDLVFGYVGVKQWDEFVETFDISKSSQLPKLIVWDRNEEYEVLKFELTDVI
uniref:Thioredoxin domain-containing protein n=1 Tax=Leersia perrieri TaxID=77586 RepID=A0A0D9W530_9ORYZ